MVFRVISWVMLAVFVLSMAVQYNDPDPIRWMAIYGVCAVFSVLAIRGVVHWLSIPVAVAYIVGALYWMPGAPIEHPMSLLTDVKMASLGVEEWREDGGLWICVAWLVALSVVWFLRCRKAAEDAPK